MVTGSLLNNYYYLSISSTSSVGGSISDYLNSTVDFFFTIIFLVGVLVDFVVRFVTVCKGGCVFMIDYYVLIWVGIVAEYFFAKAYVW